MISATRDKRGKTCSLPSAPFGNQSQSTAAVSACGHNADHDEDDEADAAESRHPVARAPSVCVTHLTCSTGRPARRQATKPPATSAAPLRSVAFERTACWQR